MSTPSDPEKADNDAQSKAEGGQEWDNGVQLNEGNQPWPRRLANSFKRDPRATITNTPVKVEGAGPRAFDSETAAERTANSGLQHKLKGRHMQMIAIGGAIGKSRHHQFHHNSLLTTPKELVSS